MTAQPKELGHRQTPVIETERLTLRPPRRADAGLMALHTADRRVAEATRSIPHPLPPGATEAFLERALSGERHEDFWVIDGTRSGLPEVLGLLTAEPVGNGQAEVRFWIAPPYWNIGVATEALRALIDANPRGWKTLFAAVFQDNPASARVLTNCGFEYLGDAEQFSVARGRMVPTWTYARKLD